jgi:hypothetical protein
MSRTASKLTNSVRQARSGQGAEQGAGQGEESPEGATSAETAAEAPESPAPSVAPRKTREEEPLPRMPSRRVWPD